MYQRRHEDESDSIHTFSHPENDRDITCVARQIIYAARRIIYASIPGISFEREKKKKHVTPAIISIFIGNSRWRHGRSRREKSIDGLLSVLPMLDKMCNLGFDYIQKVEHYGGIMCGFLDRERYLHGYNLNSETKSTRIKCCFHIPEAVATFTAVVFIAFFNLKTAHLIIKSAIF